MKRFFICCFMIAMFFCAVPPANAGDHAAAGAILGAGSGILIGNAVGRNPEAAVFGGIIGGVVGLLIGNEYDHAGRPPMYYPRRYPTRPPHHAWHPNATIGNHSPYVIVIPDRRHNRRGSWQQARTGRQRQPDRRFDRHVDRRHGDNRRR